MTNRFSALSSHGAVDSIDGMADSQQKHQKPKRPPYPGAGTSGEPRNLGQDDRPRHAPESGDPTETGRGRAPDLAGDRDESGRLGGDAK